MTAEQCEKCENSRDFVVARRVQSRSPERTRSSTNMKKLILSLGIVAMAAVVGCTQPMGTNESGAPVTANDKAFPKMAAIAVDAKFERWLPTPSGEVMGMMLDNGTIVHVRDVDTNVLKPGDAIHVEGKSFGENKTMIGMAEVKKDGKVLIAAPEFKGDFKGHHGKWNKDGEKKGDKGDKGAWKAKHAEKMAEKKAEHDKKMESLAPMSADAKVVALLPGRHGKVHGFVLSDGTVAYLPRHHDTDVAVKTGDTIKVEGRGGAYPAGKALEIKTLEVNGQKTTL
jgi:hypothetical protein